MAQDQNLATLAQSLTANSTSISTNSFVGSFMGPKSFMVLGPVAADVYPIFWTNAALSIAEIKTIVSGSTPSVTASFYWGADGSGATSNTLIQGSIVTTNTTSGNTVTSLANNTPIANSFLWAYVNAVSGTVNTYSITLRFN